MLLTLHLFRELVKVEQHERNLTSVEGTLKKKYALKFQELEMQLKKNKEEVAFRKSIEDKKLNDLTDKLKNKSLYCKKLEAKNAALEDDYFALKKAKLSSSEFNLNKRITELELEKNELKFGLKYDQQEKQKLFSENQELKLLIDKLTNAVNHYKTLENQRNKRIIAKLEMEARAKENQHQLLEEKKELARILEEVNLLESRVLQQTVEGTCPTGVGPK